MDLVLVESPYAGDVDNNVAYAKECVRDCLRRGEAPYASHLFFTQDGLLDDTVEHERALGIKAGLEWGRRAAKTAVYMDYGMSRGMVHGVLEALKINRPIELRRLRGPVTEEDAQQLTELRASSPATRPGFDSLFSEIVGEVLYAESKFAPFNSSHEAYAVLQEEVDELWDDIKKNRLTNARKEAVQVTAMGLRFLRDFPFTKK